MKSAQFVLYCFMDYYIRRGGPGSQTVGLTYYVIVLSIISRKIVVGTAFLLLFFKIFAGF